MSLEFNIDLHFFGISNFLNGNYSGSYHHKFKSKS